MRTIFPRQVFVLEDDEAYRASLISLIRSAGMAARGFGNAESLLAELRSDTLAIVLLDLRLPGMSGREAFNRLSEHPRACLEIIVVTGWADVATAVDLMKAGAVDLLQKPVDAPRLLQTLETVFEGLWARHARMRNRDTLSLKLSRLTSRERQVFALVIEGLSNRQTSERLGISHRTVDIFRLSMMKKLEVRSIQDLHKLEREASEAGIIPSGFSSPYPRAA